MTLTDRIPLADVLSRDRTLLLRVAERVKNNEVFAYPTETIYGIGGRADGAAAEDRIKSIKGRLKQTPFILLAADLNDFSSYDVVFPSTARVLARKFWPGNLTLVLPWKNRESGAGIRISNHPFIAALCGELHMPVFSTSANISGAEYKNDPDEIFSAFNGKIDFFIDAGKLPESVPSTIVKINGDGSFEILRIGAISSESIAKALNDR
jgi:L-threonylcarbamoyladenylate synthase